MQVIRLSRILYKTLSRPRTLFNCQPNFEKGKSLQSTFKYILKLLSSVYDYDVINDSWFLMLKMNGYLGASF